MCLRYAIEMEVSNRFSDMCLFAPVSEYMTVEFFVFLFAQREVTRHMKGAGFYIKQFFRKCTIIQRAWRNVRTIAYIHYNQLLEAFNKMELKFRKLQAERAIASEPGIF